MDLDRLTAADVAEAEAAWGELFEDDLELMGALLRDVVHLEMNPTRGSGRRHQVIDRADGVAALRRLAGDDFSSEEFPVAYRALVGADSLDAVAERVPLSKSQLQRLAAGTKPPTVQELRVIAEAFGKPPWYFTEYRVMLIAEAVTARMARSPETSMAWFARLGLGRGA